MYVKAACITEGTAGSDVASVKLRAVRDGDDFILNGSKVLLFCFICRTI